MSSTWDWKLEDAIEELDAGIFLIDLGFQNRKEVVAAYLLVSDDELVLIETGPGSTIDHLRRAMKRIGFTFQDLTRVLVTHIHLDHAGAAGLIARENPGVTVHVHPFGAAHLIDPTKLINSATRIYGDQMGPLWGEFAPIPANQVVAFEDEQSLRGGGAHHAGLFHPRACLAPCGVLGSDDRYAVYRRCWRGADAEPHLCLRADSAARSRSRRVGQ